MSLKTLLFGNEAQEEPAPLDGLAIDPTRARAMMRFCEGLAQERGVSSGEALLGIFEGSCLPSPPFSRRIAGEVLAGKTSVRDALSEVFERNVRGVEAVLGPQETGGLVGLALRQSEGAVFETDQEGRALCAPLIMAKLDSIRGWAWNRREDGEIYQQIGARASEQRQRLNEGTRDKCLPVRVLGFLNSYWDVIGGLSAAQCAVAETVRGSVRWADSLADEMDLVRALPSYIPKSAEGFR